MNFIYIFKSPERAWKFILDPFFPLILRECWLKECDKESYIYLASYNYFRKSKFEYYAYVFARAKIHKIFCSTLNKLNSSLKELIDEDSHYHHVSDGFIKLFFMRSWEPINYGNVTQDHHDLKVFNPVLRLNCIPKRKFHEFINHLIPFNHEKFNVFYSNCYLEKNYVSTTINFFDKRRLRG